MRYVDFIKGADYEDIVESVNKKEAFEFNKVVRVIDGTVGMRIKGTYTKEHDIWGTDYIVMFDLDERRRKNISGRGFAKAELDMFDSEIALRDFLEDNFFGRVEGYEKADYQTSLFGMF